MKWSRYQGILVKRNVDGSEMTTVALEEQRPPNGLNSLLSNPCHY